MNNQPKRAPTCSHYPSDLKVRQIARSMFRRGAPGTVDARGLDVEDFEQELHLKACELLFQNRNVDLRYVYKSLWNRGRNLRRDSQLVDGRRDYKDVPEVEYELEEHLENRSCLRVLEAALSPTHMSTLVFASMHKSGEAREAFGLSYQGWHNRLNRAREAARLALAEEI